MSARLTIIFSWSPLYYSLSTDEPVQYARPSIDVLFESAADVHGARAIAVVLTGANRDGAEGAREIRRRGGTVLVQDPVTAECPVMPEAAIQAVPDALRPSHPRTSDGCSSSLPTFPPPLSSHDRAARQHPDGR